MKLSVIICTYNRGKYLNELFESLVNQDIVKNKFEIIIINNNSSDNTEDVCSAFLKSNKDFNVSYYSETHQGLSHARNRGINESTGNILIFIDDDAVAFPDYLSEIFKFFENQPEIYAGGGKILPKYENKRPRWMSSFLEPVVSVLDMGTQIKEFKNNKYPIGANMFMRKEVFENAGNFNTKLGRTGTKLIGGEEKDLFLRLKQKKYKIYYAPNCIVYHVIPDSRLRISFIRKLALGIGMSEKFRAKNISTFELIKSFLKELFKWGASIILFLFYVISFQMQKGVMILKFRSWVSKGLIKNNLI